MRSMITTLLVAVLMAGCASTPKKTIPNQPSITSPATVSQLELGKRFFTDGYYKKALQQLLPLAAEGNMEAQYAVGYMYYYGFGAAQDTESGTFWITRSAKQHFEPAVRALAIIEQQQRRSAKTKNTKTNY